MEAFHSSRNVARASLNEDVSTRLPFTPDDRPRVTRDTVIEPSRSSFSPGDNQPSPRRGNVDINRYFQPDEVSRLSRGKRVSSRSVPFF